MDGHPDSRRARPSSTTRRVAKNGKPGSAFAAGPACSPIVLATGACRLRRRRAGRRAKSWPARRRARGHGPGVTPGHRPRRVLDKHRQGCGTPCRRPPLRRSAGWIPRTSLDRDDKLGAEGGASPLPWRTASAACRCIGAPRDASGPFLKSGRSQTSNRDPPIHGVMASTRHQRPVADPLRPRRLPPLGPPDRLLGGLRFFDPPGVPYLVVYGE